MDDAASGGVDEGETGDDDNVRIRALLMTMKKKMANVFTIERLEALSQALKHMNPSSLQTVKGDSLSPRKA